MPIELAALESIRQAYTRRDETALAQRLAATFPVDPDVGSPEAWARFLLRSGPAPAARSSEFGVLIESIETTHRWLDGARPERPAARYRSPKAWEFIADRNGAPHWSLPFFVNQMVLRTLEPRRRTALVGTMRDDGIYILEWVAHHRALGFQHIFIYTNDNRDGSDELLGLLADHGVITVIENEITGTVEPEAKAFGHAVNLLQDLRDFEWVMFLDSDEYFVPAPRFGNSVDEVLNALSETYPDGKAAAILYDWLWYVSDMAMHRTPGTLYERFEHARQHWLSKTLVRLPDVLSMRCQHHPEVRDGLLVVDSNFDVVDMTAIWERRTPQYAGGRINHYWPKSFEEFLVKKARGATLNMARNFFDRPYPTFFRWNGYATQENQYPIDPRFKAAMTAEIAALRSLPGVAVAAARIDAEFTSVVRTLSGVGDIEALYRAQRVEPGPL